MRRIRAVGTFGLVLGLSGCAGTHHHHHQHFPAQGPNKPHGPHAVAHSAHPDCGCHTPALGPPGVIGARPATLVATVAARPGFPPILPTPRPVAPPVSATPTPRPVAPPTATVSWPAPLPQPSPSSRSLPPSSRPVAVPAPAGVARHYFSSFDEEGLRSVWEMVPPDLLGVRTSMVPATPAETETETETDGPVPLHRDALDSLSLAPLGPGEAAAPAADDATAPPAIVESGSPDPSLADLTPVSAVVSTPETASTGLLPPPGAAGPPLTKPDLDVGEPSVTPAPTLVLEHADASELAGRPRLPAPAEPPLVQHDQDEPSTWVSELAFQHSRTPARPALHLPKVVRGNDPLPDSRRTSVVSRFVRRVRVAGRAFLDPDSVRRESSDLAKQGEGVERASTHGLGEAPKR